MNVMSQDKSKIKGMMVVSSGARGGQYVANWRVDTPEIDHQVCVNCRLCITYCPEAAITSKEKEKPQIDYRFCKGCGVCANECPSKAIKMKKEEGTK